MFGGYLVAARTALLLWPAHVRGALRRFAAAACTALASMVRAGAATGTAADVRQHLDAATAAIAKLRTTYRSTQHRPAGLTQQDRALAELVANLDRTIALFGQQDAAATAHWGPPRDAARELAETVADVLDRSAATLADGDPPPNVERLGQALASHAAALTDWAGTELRAGTDVARVLRGLELAHPIRLLSYLAYEIGTSATVLGARESTASAWLTKLARARSETATHLRLRSVWVRSGLRAGSALGLSVLVARLTGVDHGFWVVLGTLSVLRGSASATGRTSFQSFVGTIVGFTLATMLLLAGGSNPVVLWIALPICLFLAGYTPTAVHFVVGQAAFTLLVVVLFNLLDFQGVHVGVVRLQDVAMGIAVSLVSGFLLWPRGPRAQLPGALAALYRCCADYLELSMGGLFGRPADATALASSLQAASAQDERSGEVFSQLLEQPGSEKALGTWNDLFASGKRLMLIGDIFQRLADEGYRPDQSAPHAEKLADAARRTLTRVEWLARFASPGTAEPLPTATDITAEREEAERAGLAAWDGRGDEALARSSIGLVFAGDWVDQLEELVARLAAELKVVDPTKRVPWWT
ncbi:MAG: FUSC family protein [Chloroflexi bacterium]|nr:FUSC family protein [Chloroflexota bacterium]